MELERPYIYIYVYDTTIGWTAFKKTHMLNVPEGSYAGEGKARGADTGARGGRAIYVNVLSNKYLKKIYIYIYDTIRLESLSNKTHVVVYPWRQ